MELIYWFIKLVNVKSIPVTLKKAKQWEINNKNIKNGYKKTYLEIELILTSDKKTQQETEN